jgi:hypothetical protein
MRSATDPGAALLSGKTSVNASWRIRLALLACFSIAAIILLQKSISGTEGGAVSNATTAVQFTASSNAAAERVESARSTPDSIPTHAGPGIWGQGDMVPTFEQLASAADAGDARAACMLGTLITMCGYQDQGADFKEALLEGAAISEPGGETERISTGRVARMENARRKYESFCVSLTRQQRSQSFDRMLQASRLGSTRAAVRFFLQPPMRTETGGIALDRVEKYQRHAIDGLEQAALKGNGLAMYTLFDLLATGRFESNEVAFNSKVERGKAMALGRALLPILDPLTFALVSKSLRDIEAQASPRELEEARIWSSKFLVDPDQTNLDGLPNPAEEIEHCSKG